nr:rhodanese-like domain-containing protein [Zophobihabitans entericus]
MSIEQIIHYQSKLAYEMDSADLYLSLNQKENIVIVDGRSPEAYENEHIPGAINLWHKEMCLNNVNHLDKNKVYICYCDGIGCNASTKTALKLLTLGFQVKELIGGLDWWKRDGYATEGINATSGSGIGCSC